MELIERYLQAVQFWLPASLKKDIITELSEDIYSQIEEREAGLGRKLTKQEIADYLKQRGAPVIVANRYLPQQSLIGPLLFPVYLFVLKIVFIAYLVPWMLTMVGLILFNPAYHAGWVAHSWVSNLGSISGALWNSVFITAGVVTLVFAVIERMVPDQLMSQSWNPMKLPPVRNFNKIPRVNSYFEVATGLLVGGWMAATMYSPVIVDQPQTHVVLTSAWTWFFWGFLLLTLANAALSTANLLHPYWTRTRATLRFLCQLAGSVLFCWLCKVNIFVEMTLPNLSAQQAHDLPIAINYWMNKSFPYAVLACLIIAGTDIYRIVRIKDEAGLPNGLGTAPAGNFHHQ